MIEAASSKPTALVLAALAMSSRLSGCSDRDIVASCKRNATIYPKHNDFVVTGDGHILWNRVVVTQDDLSTFRLSSAKRVPKPELTFQP